MVYLFFVYGNRGCGKTFIWRTVIAKLRSESKIVLYVASSGIAATLLLGGRTAHSRFKIRLELDESSTCGIRHNSDIAELLKQKRLIIWDEAPMQNMYIFECLDRTLRDNMRSVSSDRYDLPFGGITVLLDGDLRQILPVVSLGSGSDIVSSCISRSPLWSYCKLFIPTENMRLIRGNSEIERTRIKSFSKWVLNISDGNILPARTDSIQSEYLINIPEEFCIQSNVASINDLIDSVFLNLGTCYIDVEYMRERAILTQKNKMVDHVKILILEKILGQSYTYHNVDSAKIPVGGNDELTAVYLNLKKNHGMPSHELVLKENVVVMLLRNINLTLELCNGTQMIVRKCLKHTVVYEIVSERHADTQHLIPKIEISPTDIPMDVNLV